MGQNAAQRASFPAQDASVTCYGEALARARFLEHRGGWIVLTFTGGFAFFLIFMQLAGQKPGESFLLKSISDFLQFGGECIGLVFCLVIVQRLYRASRLSLQRLQALEGARRQTHAHLLDVRLEYQNARRSYRAWALLSIAIALYACGQAIWTSYDVRMPSASVPFPGIYDIGFVSSYPFFVAGALFLTRRNSRGALVGRVRVFLDAVLVIGATFSLSWFFILQPSVAGLPQQPGFGAAFLAIYFPGGDLLLVALGAFLMFSQFATREQQSVFMRLCVGLFFLAITDSILVWLSLSYSFNTGTIQDVLWPLSMQMVGLAAIAYPRSIALEQERLAYGALREDGQESKNRLSVLSLYIQSALPFVMALVAAAILLTITPTQRFLASLIALGLFLLVAIRQTLTLNENNHLRLQLAGELVLSRRALRVTRKEADDALREVHNKQQLEQGILALQSVHSRIAQGDFSVRASTNPGPLQVVAVSFNLMIERLKDLEMRSSRYGHLVNEIATLHHVLEQLGQGLPAWPSTAHLTSRTELGTLYLDIERVQHFQRSQWRSLLLALEKIAASLERSTVPGPLENSPGRPSVRKNERGEQTLRQVEQLLQKLIEQVEEVVTRLEGLPPQQSFPSSPQSQGGLSRIYHAMQEKERKEL